MRNGGTYSNVFGRDIKMDLIEFSGETWTGEPMRFDYDAPYGTPGNITNIYAERINSNAPYRSFYGRSASNGTTRYVEDVVLQDCLWQLKDRTIQFAVKPVHELIYCRYFSIFNNLVIWPSNPTQQSYWNGFISTSNCVGVAWELTSQGLYVICYNTVTLQARQFCKAANRVYKYQIWRLSYGI